MKKIYVILFCISLVGYAQKNSMSVIDSLENKLSTIISSTDRIDVLNKIAYEYKFIEPSKNFSNATKALQLATKINYTKGIVNAKINLGYYYLIISDYTKAKIKFIDVIKIAPDKSKIALSYSGLGVIEAKQSHYPEALKMYFTALTFAEDSQDKIIQAKILSNIGSVYYDTNKFEKSIVYQKKALALSSKKGYKEDDNLRLHNIGLCYFELKQFDKCLEYIEKAETLDDKVTNVMNKISCIGVKGRVYFEKKQYDTALIIFKKQLELNNNFGDPHNIASTYSRIADVYQIKSKTSQTLALKKDYYQKALEYYTKAINLNKENGDLQNLSADYESVSKLEKSQNNFKEALVAFEIAKLYNDSVFNQDNKETIRNLEDKRVIENKEKQLKINQLQLQVQERQKWGYIFGIGFLIIMGGTLFFQNRNRKKTNKELQLLNANLKQANSVKTRFFGILNHDLRSPVANLIHFLQLQNDNPELLDEETKIRMRETTISGAENLLSSMEDILLWSKGQMENFKPEPHHIFIEQLFEDNKKVFSGYQQIEFIYKNPENIAIVTDENYLKTIIRNLTSNSINVVSTAVNPTIIWEAWQEKEICYLSIQDNGAGSSEDKFRALYDDTEVIGIKSGLGLHLIRDLAKAIHCNITVDSKINKGTTFILTFHQIESK